MNIIEKSNVPLIEAGMFNEKICFILLHKNAHTVMENLLKEKGFIRNAINIDNKLFKYFVIFRNPLERWIDGLTTYFFNKIIIEEFKKDDIINIFKDEKQIELLFTYIELDIHTSSQTRVISQIKEIKYIPILYINTIMDLLKEYVIIESIPYYHSIGKQESNVLYYGIKDLIKKFMNDNVKYKEIINNHFEKDLKLYNTILEKYKIKYGV